MELGCHLHMMQPDAGQDREKIQYRDHGYGAVIKGLSVHAYNVF